MAYDLEEQEQLEAFKRWWDKNGNTMMVLIGVLIVAFAGTQFWKHHNNQRTLEASTLYQQLLDTPAQDHKAIQALSSELMENYAATPYAGRAAVAAAKANHAAKDGTSAKSQLEWAIDHAEESAVRSVARLQLAALQLDEKAYDQALQTLDVKDNAGFEGLFADLRGDVLAAQGKTADAKQAYQQALANLEVQSAYSQYVAHKLEALGG